MDFAPPLITLLLFITVLWIMLVWKGVDPLRLVGTMFKSPQHYLTPASYAERERLMTQAKRAPQGPRTGQTLMYSDSMARLSECLSLSEMDEIILFIYRTRLINSDIKAQHFAQHVQRKLPLHALSPATLSLLIKMLHRYVKFQGVAECVQSCFHATSGIQCLELKNELERHLSIYRLVFQRIRFVSIRNEIIDHLEREAARLVENGAFTRPVKLLCDIDDTMISVLFDTRYPNLTVYPGVHQFVEELLQCGSTDTTTTATATQPQDTQDDDSSSPRASSSSRMTFLTARPEIMRKRSIRQLRASGFFHFNLLMGRLSDVVLGPRRIAAGKLENFENFRRLFAEHRFVFVGDNGQGDIDLGMDLLSQPTKYGDAMVLIHDVVRNHAPSSSSSSSTRSSSSAMAGGLHQVVVDAYRRRECEAHGIHLFQTYISAISQLYTNGLVPADAVTRVIEKTTQAHASIQYESHSQRESATREIAADLAFVLHNMPELRIHPGMLFEKLSSEIRDLIPHQMMATSKTGDVADLPV